MKKLFKTFILFLAFTSYLKAQDIAVNLVGPVSARPGSSTNFTVLVTNNGPTSASNVTLKVPAVPNLTINSVSCQAGPGTGAWASCPGSVNPSALFSGMIIPNLPDGSSVRFTISATAGASGSYTNTANVSFGSDTNTSNNSSSVTTEIFDLPCASSQYNVDIDQTLAASTSTFGANGGTLSVVYTLTSGEPVPGIGNSFTTTITYSGLNNQYGANNQWEDLKKYVLPTTPSRDLLLISPKTAYPSTGNIYSNLPAENTTLETDPNFNITFQDFFQKKLANGDLDPLGKFSISNGSLPTPAGVKMINQVWFSENSNVLNYDSNVHDQLITRSGFWMRALAHFASPDASRLNIMPNQTYVYRYTAFSNGDQYAPHNNQGVRIVTKDNYVTYGYNDAPTINSITPVSQTININNVPAQITVSASKFNTYTTPKYQWYSNTTNSNSGGTLIFGATSASYTPPTSSITTKNYYYVVIKRDGTCQTVSSPVLVSFEGACTKPATSGIPKGYTKVGITTQQKQTAWPENIPNGFISLESKEKGFVITRVQNQSSIAIPKEGMLIYDIDAKCVKLFNGEKWNCLEKSCNTADFTLNCSDVVIAGDTNGPDVSFTITIPYTNGDGSVYAEQIMNSIGVTGLTAKLSSGTLENGDGALIISVSGTIGNGGTAKFEFDINGHTCLLLASITISGSET